MHRQYGIGLTECLLAVLLFVSGAVAMMKVLITMNTQASLSAQHLSALQMTMRIVALTRAHTNNAEHYAQLDTDIGLPFEEEALDNSTQAGLKDCNMHWQVAGLVMQTNSDAEFSLQPADSDQAVAIGGAKKTELTLSWQRKDKRFAYTATTVLPFPVPPSDTAPGDINRF